MSTQPTPPPTNAVMHNYERRCPFCGTSRVVTVPLTDYLAWRRGKLVQEAFPYLSADDREHFITGICAKCFP